MTSPTSITANQSKTSSVAPDAMSGLSAHFTKKLNKNTQSQLLHELFRLYLEKDWLTHQTQFEAIIARNSEALKDLDTTIVQETFKATSYILLYLSPKYLQYSITADNSIFFQLEVNERAIYLDLFFEKQEKNTVLVEAAVNIWHNGNCAYAFSGTLKETTSKIFSNALNSTNRHHHRLLNIFKKS